MGRDCWSTRLLVEHCRVLSVDPMQRDRVFSSPGGSSWTITWADSRGQTEASLDYAFVRSDEGLSLFLAPWMTDRRTRIELSGERRIQLTATRPHFGGRRFWFRCPFMRDGKACGRRVGRLYLPPGKAMLGCRICHNLIHRSAREHDARVYRLARDPIAWSDALDDRSLRRKLLGVSAFTLWLRWEREGRVDPRTLKARA